MDYNAIMKQAYSISYGQCTKAIRNELDLESGFAIIAKEGDVIGLLKMIKHICYNFQGHRYSPQAIHDVVRKFYVQSQDPSMSVTDYLKKFQASIDVIDSVGATIRVHSQLVKEEVGLICSKYSTATRDSLAKLDSKCEERSKYRYLPTAYLMSSDCRRYGQLINEMENN